MPIWTMMVSGTPTRTIEGKEVVIKIADLIAPLETEQVESLTVEAIRDYRASLNRAENAYEALKAAEDISSDTHREKEEYTRLMLASQAQHIVLTALIERLGYVPEVPT